MLQKTLDAQADHRRGLILDAAARCFVRTGFHRATMQDVAAEAGMSPGNLYRYFRSKSAMVEGLAERDRRELAEDFAVFDGACDFMSALKALGQKHFSEEPRDKSVLCLQIWAEATRNPAFAAISAGFESDMHARFTGAIAQAAARGEVGADVDAAAVARMILILADGLYVRRAIIPNFDAAREMDSVLRVIGGLLKGAVDLRADGSPDTAPSIPLGDAIAATETSS